MKKIFKKGFFALISLTILASCKKEGSLNANLDILDRNEIAKTPVDTWLDNNFLNPYNIETKYKFDRFELALGKNIVPPMESQVIPAMEMVKNVWIKPYETVGGATFIKKYSPKQFILAGSAEFNTDGTITLGTAEGGRKIVLYVINSFDNTSLASVKQMLHVIQHEYVHILNQTVDYQTDYQTISRGGYVANWTQETLVNGRAAGFITQYARTAPEEDFAEMASNMLMMGRVTYNAAVNGTTVEGQVKLKKKEQYVVDYYKSAFNIDFYALQTNVQNELNKISAPVLSKLIGPTLGYTSLSSSPATESNQSPEFLALWNTSKTAVAAIGGAGRSLNSFQLIFGANNLLTVRYNYTNSAGSAFMADADYTMTISASGVATITLVATQPVTSTYNNMNTIRTSVAGINTYLTANKFKIDWINTIIPGNIGMVGSLGAFYKQTDNSSYFYGTMGQ